MTGANDLKAQDVLEENPVTVSSDRRLAQVKNKMEQENIRAIPVVSNGDTLEGVIGYRDLIRHMQFNPEQTKLSRVMHQPPQFDPHDSLVDLCDLRINSGKKLLVYEKGGKLKGVVGDQEFLNAFSDVKEVSDLKTARVSTRDVSTVFEDDTVERARHRMLDENISRLPVQDNNGNLVGILRSTDMLQAMVPREAPDAGGTSGNRSGNEIFIAGGNEKERMSDVTVSELMDRMVTTSEDYLTGEAAVDMMLDQDSGEIVYVDGNNTEAILTVKDLIGYVKDLKPSDAILVQLIGVDTPEEKDALHEKIATQLRGSLGRKLERPEELSVHVKKSEEDGTQHRYELIVKLHSEFGVTTVNQEGWELLDVLDEALDKLDSQIRRKREKRDDREKSGEDIL